MNNARWCRHLAPYRETPSAQGVVDKTWSNVQHRCSSHPAGTCRAPRRARDGERDQDADRIARNGMRGLVGKGLIEPIWVKLLLNQCV